MEKELYYLHGDLVTADGKKSFFCARCDLLVEESAHFYDEKRHRGGMKAHIERFKMMKKNWKKNKTQSSLFRPNNTENIFS